MCQLSWTKPLGVGVNYVLTKDTTGPTFLMPESVVVYALHPCILDHNYA